MATVLNAGDLAVVGFRVDDPDAFAIVALKGIEAGTVFYMTDNGWLAAGGFRTGEGAQSITVTQDIPAGTILFYSGTTPTALTTQDGTSVATVATVAAFGSTGSAVAFAAAGDAIIFLQTLDGTTSSGTNGSNIRNIAAFDAAGASANTYDADATSTSTSALPTGLTLGSTAQAFGNIDNYNLNVAPAGPLTAAAFRAFVNDQANFLAEDTPATITPNLRSQALATAVFFEITTSQTGGADSDVLLGGFGADTLDGGAGADRLVGFAGGDSLTGGAGADLLVGGAGDDTMVGGADDDTYNVSDLGDVVSEAAGEGANDLIITTVSYTIAANVEAIRADAASLTLTGSGSGELLVSRVAGSTLVGLGGDDVYVVGGAGNTVTEAAGGGYDVVRAEISFTAPANVEILLLNGSGLTATGAAGADGFISQGGGNTFAGLGGDDAYRVVAAGDTLLEAANEGVDTVFATISYALADNFEILFLRGTGLTGTGNGAANTLFADGGTAILNGGGGADSLFGSVDGDALNGDGGDDRLFGGAGVDTVNGGAGSDLLVGGVGGDRFVFSAASDSAASAADLIADFEVNVDLVDLTAIDADTVAAGDQAFTFVASFTGVRGQATLVFDATVGRTAFNGDTDGDGVADVIVILNGSVGQGDGFLL